MTTLNRPEITDGYAVNKLVSQTPPLDTNSTYCNLLQCSHFADSSVIAKRDHQVIGFISGYQKPGDNQTLFIWQVAVAKAAQGEGLASQMLESLLTRKNLDSVKYLETTITQDNKASWGLFNRLARTHNAELNTSDYFDQEKHFKGDHDSEVLVRIGPFTQ